MMLTTKATARTRAIHHSVPLLRLLWKEFRERRVWAICWALAILAVSLFAHGQRFCGDAGGMLSPWNALPIILAGVVGLCGYTGELKGGRALFLFTRAVRWHEVLLAKVLFGAVIILGVPLLAAGIFRLTCPEPYRQFVTLPNVLSGVGVLSWPIAFCYLFGLACSVILPGLAGGVLTVTSIFILILLMLGGSALIDLLPNYSEIGYNNVNFGILFFAALGILWGSVSALRSGLYHHYTQRIKRFAPKLILSMLIGGVVCLCLPLSPVERLFLHRDYEGSCHISPGGSYAIVSYTQRFSLCGIDAGDLGGVSSIVDSHKDVIRLADNAVLHRFTTEELHNFMVSNEWFWLTDKVAVGFSFANGSDSANSILFYPDTGKTIPVATVYIGRPSPNGHFTVSMLNTHDDKQGRDMCYIYFYNLENGHAAKVNVPVENDYALHNLCWWESNDTVGYYISHGYYGIPPNKRRNVPVFHEEVHHLRMPKF